MTELDMKSELKLLLDRELSRVGFVSKQMTWYLRRNGYGLAVFVMKNRWKPVYYLQLGLWLESELETLPQVKIGKASFPKAERCPLLVRVTDIIGLDDPSVRAALDDSEVSTTREVRGNIAQQYVARHVVPFIETLQSIDGVQEALEKGVFRRGLVTPQLHAWFADHSTRNK